jgi:GDP-mannose 6-dehydrogenase
MIHKAGHRRVGINGLSFKPGTDDLRESPIVLVAEHLIGKGYEVKIHDHAIQTTRITGANREYIEQHVPHLASRLVNDERELIEHSETLVLVRDGAALLEQAAALGKLPRIVDLRGKTCAIKPRSPASIRPLPCSQQDMAAVAAYGNG